MARPLELLILWSSTHSQASGVGRLPTSDLEHTLLAGQLGASETVGVIMQHGTLDHAQLLAQEVMRQELAVLAASQLGFSRRRSNARPWFGPRTPVGTASFFVASADGKRLASRFSSVGKQGPLNLDENWLGFQDSVFFSKLVRIIQGKVQIADDWRQSIQDAAVFIGESQTSTDLMQAFLWNMIALELLLVTSNDNHSKELPARAEALLGWAGEWTSDQYDKQIKEAYGMRNKIVHAGDRQAATIQALLFTDRLLMNLLMNIVNHPKLFHSKQALVDFSKRVQAERTLGIKPRVRPRTLKHIRPTITPEHLKGI